jgi:hypothetical protein
MAAGGPCGHMIWELRSTVLWVGTPPSDSARSDFETRDLHIDLLDASHAPLDWSTVRAVMVNFDGLGKGVMLGAIATLGPIAANHGALLFIHVHGYASESLGDAATLLVQSRLGSLHSKSYLLAQDAEMSYVAQRIARHDPGPPAPKDDKPAIECEAALTETDKLLMRRAFFDCSRVRASVLKGGLSDARVMAVDAFFENPDVDPSPLPFLAKIDTREKTLSELQTHRQFVRNYVPFANRPNVEDHRCAFGAQDGVLISDFVENAVTLEECIAIRDQSAILHSLFDEAFRGWRRQRRDRPSDPRRSLGELVKGYSRHEHISAEVLEYAHSQGETLTASELMVELDRHSRAMYKIESIHGDLHARNVMVRNADAILIDFSKTTRGPVLLDVASLEVSICFGCAEKVIRGEPRERQSEMLTNWTGRMAELYTSNTLKHIPPLCDHSEPFGWLQNAVRQLRLRAYSLQVEQTAYVALLILCLVRKASFASDDFPPGTPCWTVGARAYVYASILLSWLAAAEPT